MTEQSKKSKGMLIALIAMGVLLVGAVLAMILVSTSKTKQLDEARNLNEQLQLTNEQLQLANEYQALNIEFQQYENQTQMLANDSLNIKYNAAKQKVEKLLQELNNEKTKSAKRIKELEGEISTLKGIMRHYVAQIDSLGKENAGLRAENEQIKTQNQQLSTQVASVSQQNERLNERMTLAEKLNVTGVKLTSLKKNGKEEKNITKAKQLMVTFTIPQNNSTPVGMKKIYLRIVNPEGDVLSGGPSFTFEGATLSSTAMKAIEYQGEEVSSIKIYWDVNTTLNPGEYTVELFCDNYRLASRRFTMKK